MLRYWAPCLVDILQGLCSMLVQKRTGWMGPAPLGMQVCVLAASGRPAGDGFMQLCYAEGGCKGICANDNS